MANLSHKLSELAAWVAQRGLVRADQIEFRYVYCSRGWAWLCSCGVQQRSGITPALAAQSLLVHDLGRGREHKIPEHLEF